MIDFVSKSNDTAGASGQVEDFEYNSAFQELNNLVTGAGLTLDADESDTQTQLREAVDRVSKAIFYEDTGVVNAIQLSRGVTTETLETLFDGMLVMFSPANENTGATTLKINTLLAKPLKYNGVDLPSGFLNINEKYIAIYDGTNEWFECFLMAGVNTFGVNQSWQDVTGLRTDNVYYTNLESSPIMISATASNTSSTSSAVRLFVDDVEVDEAISSYTPNTETVQAVVPSGSTYRLTLTNTFVIANWREFK